MAKQQKEFGALIKMMKTNFEDSTREEKEKKKKKDEKKKEKKEKESSARTTVMTSRLDKRGRSQVYFINILLFLNYFLLLFLLIIY